MTDLFSLELEQIFTNDAFLNATKRLKHVSFGLDGLKVNEVCFDKLKDEILSQTYAPTPLKELFIPKENKNELRHLGIPSFKDKIAQNMLAFELNKYFDKLFSSSSYAYRQGKSYKNAVFRARDFFRKYSHVIKTDIKDFFESINHEILLEILNAHIADKRIIRLITLWIKNGEFLRYSYFKHHKGVHQGDVLSPLLSNIYLNQMDKFLEQNELDFVRYADDFVIFAVSEQDATNTLKMLENFLLTIKLNLNQNKTAIHDKFSDFTFLGVNFKGEELSISDEKFRQTLAKLSSQIKQQEINTAITNLNAYISHLKTIKLQLFSPEQKENFNAHFNQTITNLVRKFIKILDKKAIADALLNLEFAYPVTNTLKKQLLLSYYKNAKLPRVKSITATLEAKKREYLRNFAKDSVLHVTTPFLFLAILQGKFVLKQNGKITHKFPISKITQIIINTQISLSSAVIYECSKRKISIDFIDEKTNLSYATLFTSNNAIPKNTTSQISILKTKKSLRIAQQFIIGKIKNQINYLKYLNKYHKNLDKNIKTMQEILTIKVPNSTNISELMGFEGLAANAYWQGIAAVIDYKFDFNSRITKGATDIVNSSLNYAYAILYSKILKSIVTAGLSPHVSYLHALDEQKPTLAFDLIEEFRAFIVDRTIISMINKNEPFHAKDGLLDAQTRQNIAKNINEKFLSYTRYRGENLTGEDIITRQAYALKRSILENQKYKAFIGRFQ